MKLGLGMRVDISGQLVPVVDRRVEELERAGYKVEKSDDGYLTYTRTVTAGELNQMDEAFVRAAVGKDAPPKVEVGSVWLNKLGVRFEVTGVMHGDVFWCADGIGKGIDSETWWLANMRPVAPARPPDWVKPGQWVRRKVSCDVGVLESDSSLGGAWKIRYGSDDYGTARNADIVRQFFEPCSPPAPTPASVAQSAREYLSELRARGIIVPTDARPWVQEVKRQDPRTANRSLVATWTADPPRSVLDGRGRKQGPTWELYCRNLANALEWANAREEPVQLATSMRDACESYARNNEVLNAQVVFSQKPRWF